MPEGEFTATAFFQRLAQGRLVASRCRACGGLHVPPRPVCPTCHAADMEQREMSGRGRLVAFTAVSIAPSFMAEEGYGRENPYVAGIVELEEGPRVSARILGLDAKAPERIAIGAPLSVRFVQPKGGQRPFLAFGP